MKAFVRQHEWNSPHKGPIELTLIIEPSELHDSEVQAWLHAWQTHEEVEISPPRPTGRGSGYPSGYPVLAYTAASADTEADPDSDR
jgi:hypothetical protein